MGGWKIFTRNGGEPGMGGGREVGFIMGEWEIFSLFTYLAEGF